MLRTLLLLLPLAAPATAAARSLSQSSAACWVASKPVPGVYGCELAQACAGDAGGCLIAPPPPPPPPPPPSAAAQPAPPRAPCAGEYKSFDDCCAGIYNSAPQAPLPEGGVVGICAMDPTSGGQSPQELTQQLQAEQGGVAAAQATPPPGAAGCTKSLAQPAPSPSPAALLSLATTLQAAPATDGGDAPEAGDAAIPLVDLATATSSIDPSTDTSSSSIDPSTDTSSSSIDPSTDTSSIDPSSSDPSSEKPQVLQVLPPFDGTVFVGGDNPDGSQPCRCPAPSRACWRAPTAACPCRCPAPSRACWRAPSTPSTCP
jgi:hypothetical protein